MKLIEEGIESCCGEFDVSPMLGWMCRWLRVDVVLSMAVLGCVLRAMNLEFRLLASLKSELS